MVLARLGFARGSCATGNGAADQSRDADVRLDMQEARANHGRRWSPSLNRQEASTVHLPTALLSSARSVLRLFTPTPEARHQPSGTEGHWAARRRPRSGGFGLEGAPIRIGKPRSV
jgi:hypothetical protein